MIADNQVASNNGTYIEHSNFAEERLNKTNELFTCTWLEIF